MDEFKLEFAKFPKVKRLKRDCVITEKLDGTNAQINFNLAGDMLCGSRNRVIVPEDDNYGFAKWAFENKEELFKILGEGRHYGEWWGQGIQRGYNMECKMFSLFNTGRWCEDDLKTVEQLSVVPTLFEGLFSTEAVDNAMRDLADTGSRASKGFYNPEGVVVYHSQVSSLFKLTYLLDDGKWTGKYDDYQGEL